MTSLQRTARITGLAYLGLAASGALGFLVIRPRLYVPGEAARTVANLVAHETLARIAIAADLTVVLTQAIAALCFYLLYRRVHAVAAGAVTAFGLMNSVAVMVGTMFSATALGVALRGDAGDTLTLYDLQAAAWLVGGLFFGLWLIPMGWLVLRSGYQPRVLGWLLMAGGVGYVLSTFTAYLFPGVPALSTALVIPASLGEFWMIGYLLIIGVSRRHD
jgi:hypothetical protein